MELTVLSDFQAKVLSLFKKTSLAKRFYLAGGTALAEFYLKHRKSEDLDFFTQEELNLREIKKFSRSLEKIFPLDRIEYQKGFGLFTFFFYPKGEVAKYKIDFGQYPFGPIEELERSEERFFDEKQHPKSCQQCTSYISQYTILTDWLI